MISATPKRSMLFALFILLQPVLALGADTLLDNVRYQDRDDYIELEIHLGFPVEIDSFEQTQKLEFGVLLHPAAEGSTREWRAMELSFDEDDRLLESVRIDGNDRDGYRLDIVVRHAVEAQLLPQFDDRQVLLKLSRRREFVREAFGDPSAGDPYAINLESRNRTVPGLDDIPEAFASTHTIYLTSFEEEGVTWHRLRLGFFEDASKAEATTKLLRRYFPDAWVVQVSPREVSYAKAFRINPVTQLAKVGAEPPAVAEPEPASAPAPAPAPARAPALATAPEDVTLKMTLTTPSNIDQAGPGDPELVANDWKERDRVEPEPPSELDALLEQARDAFESGRWDEAIALYDKILSANLEPYRQRALEMLGVAREQNGQLAHAMRYYRTYLAEYPGTDGASRVDQRLAALIALDGSTPPSSGTRTTSRQAERVRLNAQLSQFYQRHSLQIDDRSSVPINGIFNDLNVQAARRGEDLDQELRVTMSYLLDFTDNERLNGREYQVSTAYWYGRSERLRTGLRLGRQSRWDSGALGRFDGAVIDYQATGRINLSTTGGYLIDAPYESPGGERPFFAFSGEYLSSSGQISVKPFFVQQYADGLLDRQALGLYTQFYSQRGMFYSLVDYDLHYSALNNLTLSGNLKLGRSQLNAAYEHRKSPYLTTRNALLGQRFDDLTALEEAFLDATLEELAADRTATSDTLRIGWNSHFSDHWALSADLVSSKFESTQTSFDVIGLDAQKTLYSSVQLRAIDPFGRGTFSAMTVRVADSQTSTTTSLYWDNRLTLPSAFFLYPRVRVDHRSYDQTGDEQWSVMPSLRLDFRPGRRIRFELESGYQWTTREFLDRQLDITGFYVRAGYRASL